MPILRLTQTKLAPDRYRIEAALESTDGEGRRTIASSDFDFPIGARFFDAVFEANRDSRDLWAEIRNRLNGTRVEISTGVQEAAALPWELLRDPKTDTPYAEAALRNFQSFGDRAADMIQRTQRLIMRIEQDRQSS